MEWTGNFWLLLRTCLGKTDRLEVNNKINSCVTLNQYRIFHNYHCFLNNRLLILLLFYSNEI